jgi:uncharacterized membrane protein (DUF2068 family)
VRGSAALLIGITLLVLSFSHHGEWVQSVGRALRRHATGAWTLKLAEIALSPKGVHRFQLGALALIADGSFTLFEGWALHRRWAFAPWLVVLATASFLPWEVARLIRAVRWGRLAALILNLAVVAYLARKALRDRLDRVERREHTT